MALLHALENQFAAAKIRGVYDGSYPQMHQRKLIWEVIYLRFAISQCFFEWNMICWIIKRELGEEFIHDFFSFGLIIYACIRSIFRSLLRNRRLEVSRLY